MEPGLLSPPGGAILTMLLATVDGAGWTGAECAHAAPGPWGRDSAPSWTQGTWQVPQLAGTGLCLFGLG